MTMVQTTLERYLNRDTIEVRHIRTTPSPYFDPRTGVPPILDTPLPVVSVRKRPSSPSVEQNPLVPSDGPPSWRRSSSSS